MFAFSFSYAQLEDRGTYMLLKKDSLGIGVRPRHKLEVSGGTKLGKSLFGTIVPSSENSWIRDTWLTSQNGLEWDQTNHIWRRGASPYNDFGGIIWEDGSTYFIRSVSGEKLEFTNEELLQNSFMTINNTNGYIGVNTNKPDSQFTVKGEIHALEVKINTEFWADFVFSKNYQLPKLSEVENFIAKYGHLQHIPSEKEVVKEGIELGEMNRLLLQKIEELMLYSIDQDKRISKLEAQLSKFQQ